MEIPIKISDKLSIQLTVNPTIDWSDVVKILDTTTPDGSTVRDYLSCTHYMSKHDLITFIAQEVLKLASVKEK
jgi:hypothetical protein